MRARKPFPLALFLFGLGSETYVHLIGYIAISELIFFFWAPIVFFQDMALLRRDGFLKVSFLAVLSCIGCIISSWYNHVDLGLFYRGFSGVYALFAVPIVLHRLLRQNLNGIKWYFIGAAISSIIAIFAFHNGSASSAVENGYELSESSMYLMVYFGPSLTIPLFCFYLSSPMWLSISLFVFPSVKTMLTSASGRSAVLVTLMSLAMMMFASRKRSRMRKLRKNFMLLLVGGLVVTGAFASLYKYAAMNGYLTAEAQEKYVAQKNATKAKGLLGIIMGGRSEFFVGLSAALDNPIFGLGPWPVDRKGYYLDFVSKWGNVDDWQKFMDYYNYKAERSGGALLLPVHSVIISSWLGSGIFGFPIWLFVLYKMFELMRKYLDAVPQWFGYFAMMIPGNLWAIFFSPFGGRISWGVFITMILMAISVGKGKVRLPIEMEREIQKAEGGRF